MNGFFFLRKIGLQTMMTIVVIICLHKPTIECFNLQMYLQNDIKAKGFQFYFIQILILTVS